jgi:plastocyanin
LQNRDFLFKADHGILRIYFIFTLNDNPQNHFMKKIYSLSMLIAFALAAHATVHIITVKDFGFTPQNIPNVVCNDTIKFQWVNGSHTTTSLSVPTGAITWDAPMNSANPTFLYKVTVAGSYGYKCTPHMNMGMVGGFTANCLANAVADLNNTYQSTAYPNPFSNKVIIETQDADMITLYNMMGTKIKTIALQHGQTKAEINASDLSEGIYFYCIIKEGIAVETRKIVKN